MGCFWSATVDRPGEILSPSQPLASEILGIATACGMKIPRRDKAGSSIFVRGRHFYNGRAFPIFN